MFELINFNIPVTSQTPTPERKHLSRFLLPLVALLISTAAHADIFRPAYFELTELGETEYQVLWRVPAAGAAQREAINVVFPEGVTREPGTRPYMVGNAWEQRYKIDVPGGLYGKDLRFDGQRGSATDIIARVLRSDGSTQLERLSPVDAQFTVTPSPGAGEVAWAYLVLGVEHILGGIDHLLFVLALLLLVRNLRRLVWTITAFTVAHSITLVLATLGWINLPGPPVEAIIALSIVFVAAEVIHEQRGISSLTARSPWIVAFGFGLLHGLGFAGALAEVGLPETAIPVALLMFNVGVETGQLMFVAAVVALAYLIRRFTPFPPESFSRAIAYGIGSIAAFWTIERVVAVLA